MAIVKVKVLRINLSNLCRLGVISEADFDMFHRVCAHSSTEIISLISTIVNSTGERRTWLGAWWFSLYYTFNAALVLFATILVVRSQSGSGPSVLRSSISTDDLQRSLVSAAISLRQLDTRNRMIDRCAEYVEKIIEVLDMSCKLSATLEMRPSIAVMVFY